MELDDMKAMLQSFLGMVSPENQAAASEKLTTLSDEITRVYSESESNASKVTELTANNEKLRDVNAKLFLRMGTPNQNAESNEPKTKKEGEQDDVKPTFDSLFDENGGLK